MSAFNKHHLCPPPYPWFGGKNRILPTIWQALGDVPNFVDPFLGSGVSIFGRPHWPFDGRRTETVNDLDGMVANFWRAVQSDGDAVAYHADWPVNECDLHARHLWLVNEGRQHVERLKTETDYYDAKIAGWWVWGICQWIGSGWCEHPEWKTRPHLGTAGQGVHRPAAGVYDLMATLQERFRNVRVCCGDWTRVLGDSPTVKQGLTGILLDPPYTQTERNAELYAVETNVAADVREWCRENGHRREMRIVLCGYQGEGHEELCDHGWREIAWKASGGYGSQGADTAGRENAHRERLWLSPHCLKVDQERQRSLFSKELVTA